MATAALFGWPHAKTWFAAKTDTAPGNSASAKPGGDAQLSPPPAITVARVTEAAFVAETVVTGTLVPRQEILVSPQIEGQQIAELLVDAGERVTEGQVLARLAGENIDAQPAQNSAAIARATAAIAQADSGIAQAAARLDEAEAQLKRTTPLRNSGVVSGSVFDQREAAAKTAAAQLAGARDGLALAKADKALAEAQRRELSWRRANTEIKAPRAGIVSRRSARVGAVASAIGEPMFRIIADGEVELEAQIPEAQIAQLRQGQSATVWAAGVPERTGTIRLVSPEVDRTTRLGSVRILLGAAGDLKIGGFARARIVTATSRGLSVPAAAVMHDATGAYVLAVETGRAVQKRIRLGIASGDRVEVVEGLSAGSVVVARAGTFLRDGDRLTPIDASSKPADRDLQRQASTR